MAKKKNEIVVSKVVNDKKETKSEIVEKKLLRYKPSIISNYSGLIIILLFAVICYLSVIKSTSFIWLLFGIVSLPILRRNYGDVSVIILGLALVVCATSGIIFNGLTEMKIMDHTISVPMSYGIAILGLLYLSLITFYKNIKFYDTEKTILFYIVALITSYPILIIIIFLGSLLGFLGEALLKAIMYLVIALPVILAIYLILSNRNRKVVEVKYEED